MNTFDEDAAAQPNSGIFGLPHGPKDARIHVLGVPFDATTSYRRGAMHGPEAVVAASRQVELHDRDFGSAHEDGIHYVPDDGPVAQWNEEARTLADPIIAAGGANDSIPSHADAIQRIDALGQAVREHVFGFTSDCLRQDKLPVLLGGDHSIPLGAMEAATQHVGELGVLHFDAHADLRPSFEGFRWSHASIFHNLLEESPGIQSLVQVGVRDLGHREALRCQEDPAIHTLFDDQWAALAPASQERKKAMDEHLRHLPENVWISFDIDALTPDLCPHTGTPVPGGLDWHSTRAWLLKLAQSGRKVIGLDLCEVAPGPNPDREGVTWDAIVGARLLYSLIGAARMRAVNRG